MFAFLLPWDCATNRRVRFCLGLTAPTQLAELDSLFGATVTRRMRHPRPDLAEKCSGRGEIDVVAVVEELGKEGDVSGAVHDEDALVVMARTYGLSGTPSMVLGYIRVGRPVWCSAVSARELLAVGPACPFLRAD